MNEGQRVILVMPDGERREATVVFVSGAYRDEVARCRALTITEAP